MKPSRIIAAALFGVTIVAFAGPPIARAANGGGNGGGGHGGGGGHAGAAAGGGHAHAAAHAAHAHQSRMSRWHTTGQRRFASQTGQHNWPERRWQDGGGGWPYGYGYWGGGTIVDEDADHDQWESLCDDSHSTYLECTKGNPTGPSHTWVVRDKHPDGDGSPPNGSH